MRVRKMRRDVTNTARESRRPLGGVIKNQTGSVEELLDSSELHRQAALADFHEADALSVLLALLMLNRSTISSRVRGARP